MRSHRVTVEQMAMLEPGLAETDVRLAAGGHARGRGRGRRAAASTGRPRSISCSATSTCSASVIFGEREGAFSDACNKAIEFGKPVLMRDDWKRIFEPEEIAASIRRIT